MVRKSARAHGLTNERMKERESERKRERTNKKNGGIERNRMKTARKLGTSRP